MARKPAAASQADATSPAPTNIPRDELLKLYRDMLLIRRFEEKAGQLYGMGLIGGFCHLYIGQEAVVVGLEAAAKEGDKRITSYRDHGHMLAAGMEARGVMAELTGRIGGYSKGKGGSMHMFSREKHFYGGHGIVGAQVPLGAGLAFADKYLGNDNVTFTYFGDGAANQGQVYETYNMAELWSLPVVFVIDNNQWAYSTPAHLEFAIDHLADRAAAYGFEGVVVDGTDVLAVYREAKRAIEKAREGGGPTLIESVTLRMEGHAVHDDAFYVPKELFEEWAKRDPIERFRGWLRDNADLSNEEEEDITGRVKKLLNDALSRAEESPQPDPATLMEGVYATPDDLDTPHHK